jgi:hypothetical protein
MRTSYLLLVVICVAFSPSLARACSDLGDAEGPISKTHREPILILDLTSTLALGTVYEASASDARKTRRMICHCVPVGWDAIEGFLYTLRVTTMDNTAYEFSYMIPLNVSSTPSWSVFLREFQANFLPVCQKLFAL